MPRERTLNVTLMATVLTLSLMAPVTGLGVGLAGANHPDDAPDLSEYADFRVNFPNPSDHYPGDQNTEGGSIEYFASGADAFAEQDAEEGIYIDWIIVHAEYEGEDWIDYSACDVPNTKAFGIDRGNDNEGTNYDEDLVQKQKRSWFRDDGIVINFYEWEDIGNNPPYMAPEDAIVAAQGEGSTDGPCLTLTEEPGWYRIAAFMNGTIADNGPDAQPSDSAEQVSLELNSNNYLYVCECDSEAEAREQLGPPPGETSSTPTETPGDDPTPTDTPTETPGDDPTPTATPGDDPTATTTSGSGGTQTNTGNGGTSPTAPDGDGGGNQTPTPGEGPGFGPLAALIALLATALLANRRR